MGKHPKTKLKLKPQSVSQDAFSSKSGTSTILAESDDRSWAKIAGTRKQSSGNFIPKSIN
ncbi:CLUMA_CG019777, isoform A [Clunio marinus]|uniref:CLUMA_CG019777, isoform A n=1 Tax=Clunio marinus TaxID=568069 RepID=A0A1J1J2A3_9DIPT|nr:CLUMA_CG019777, isoform A [Clunio marinus]